MKVTSITVVECWLAKNTSGGLPPLVTPSGKRAADTKAVGRWRVALSLAEVC